MAPNSRSEADRFIIAGILHITCSNEVLSRLADQSDHDHDDAGAADDSGNGSNFCINAAGSFDFDASRTLQRQRFANSCDAWLCSPPDRDIDIMAFARPNENHEAELPPYLPGTLGPTTRIARTRSITTKRAVLAFARAVDPRARQDGAGDHAP